MKDAALVQFAGRNQKDRLELVMSSATAAAREAVAKNDRRGIPTPVRGDDGKVAYCLRGAIIAQQPKTGG